MDYLTRFFLELEQLLNRETGGLTLPTPLRRRGEKSEKELRIVTKTEELTHRLETALRMQRAALPRETAVKPQPMMEQPQAEFSAQETFFSRPAAASPAAGLTAEEFSRFFERDARRYGKGD